MAVEERAPAFQKGLLDGLKEMGRELRAMEPDLFVVNSAHWVSTFNWYATLQDPHRGVCVAAEAPDLIPGLPYQRKGDPAFGRAFLAALTAADIPALANDSPHYAWDYAGLVPLLHMDPDGAIPVVQIPNVICADLDESLRVGRLVDQAATAAGRRAVFVASNALSHDVVRGPEIWPTAERMELDRQLIGHLERGAVDMLIDWLPAYSRDARAEMGGKILATMCGALAALQERAGPLAGRLYGSYAQSSGSGNASIAVRPC